MKERKNKKRGEKRGPGSHVHLEVKDNKKNRLFLSLLIYLGLFLRLHSETSTIKKRYIQSIIGKRRLLPAIFIYFFHLFILKWRKLSLFPALYRF